MRKLLTSLSTLLATLVLTACVTVVPTVVEGGNTNFFGDKNNSFYQEAISRTVTVHINNRGQCSGVIVDEDLIATAAHCLKPDVSAQTVSVEFSNGVRTDYEDIHSYGEPVSQMDWAILVVKDIPKKYKKIGVTTQIDCHTPPIGTPIFHIGSPAESKLAGFFGYISSYRTFGKEYGPWVGTVAADIRGGPGSSGGPIYSMTGKLLGLLVAGSPASGHKLYVPSMNFTAPGCKIGD